MCSPQLPRSKAELFKGRSETVTIELDGKRLRLSNLNKIYFPESGHTKRNLLAYYYRMADFNLAFSSRSGFGFCGATPTESRDKLFFRRTCAKVCRSGSRRFRWIPNIAAR